MKAEATTKMAKKSIKNPSQEDSTLVETYTASKTKPKAMSNPKVGTCRGMMSLLAAAF